MKLIGSSQEEVLVSNVNALSLDELFEIASRLGELETGGFRGGKCAQIKLSGTGEDYINVKSHKYPTLKENIQECISRARKIIDFYRTI